MSISATVEQMNKLNELSINSGHTFEKMLELGGYHLARFTTHRFPTHSHKKILVVCGRGNNGGGGYVAAKHLYNAGHEVSLFQPVNEIIGEHNQKNFEILSNLSVTIQEMLDTKMGDVILDCFIGTGLSSDFSEEHAHIIKRLNESGKPIVSLDVPSGMNADTGESNSVVVRPDHTVCLGIMKKAVVDNASAGVAHVYDIGIPRLFYDEIGVEYPF